MSCRPDYADIPVIYAMHYVRGADIHYENHIIKESLTLYEVCFPICSIFLSQLLPRR